MPLRLCDECQEPKVILIAIRRSFDVPDDFGEDDLVCKKCLDWLIEAFDSNE